MALSWPEIHQLEIHEDYPAAIDALEERFRADPADPEAVIRLGFNLWYAADEDLRMEKNLPVEQYAARFMQLFHEYKDRLSENADFCWAFGLGMFLSWYNFPGATEAMGKQLMDRAGQLEAFWRRFHDPGPDHPTKEELVARFGGRGIFASYYAIEAP